MGKNRKRRFIIALLVIIFLPVISFFSKEVLFEYVENEPKFLNENWEPLTVGESWVEDGRFEIKLTDVQFDSPDINGIRLCTVTMDVKNYDIVTEKNLGGMELEWLPFGRINEESGCGLERQSESVSVIAKDTAETLQYEFYVPKNIQRIRILLRVWAEKKRPKIYMMEYEFNPAEYMN